ncbi:beta/alpha barrel domain-containing protein [Tannockella kyphosi]|uniref:hypothetical protein n=1 Tax=Tannockella kyphosi TaxID=2899121 RepID=UPI002011DB11|nr:hypothetical protein [Tannockella kyphosi]
MESKVKIYMTNGSIIMVDNASVEDIQEAIKSSMNPFIVLEGRKRGSQKLKSYTLMLNAISHFRNYNTWEES